MPRTKQFNETEVLERAVELFWKQGYHATSMQDLVDYLGINRASLYDTFKGKRQLFDRALAHYRQTNMEGLRQFLAQQDSVKEGIKMLFERAIDESVQDTDRKGCFVVNTTTELAPADEQICQVILENRQNFQAILQAFLQSGVAKGEIAAEKDLSSINDLFFTLYNGIKVIAKVEPDRKKLLSAIQPALSLLN